MAQKGCGTFSGHKDFSRFKASHRIFVYLGDNFITARVTSNTDQAVNMDHMENCEERCEVKAQEGAKENYEGKDGIECINKFQ